MTKIAPFKAVRYNPDKIKDLTSVICPPYDVIPPQRQQYYHDISPHNFIHILLGKDIGGQDKYQRSANYFKAWLKEGVFIREDKPAVYFYSQQYNLKGEKKTRLGFIALLHLGDKDSSALGHEHTRLEPKEDRLRLIKAVKASLSPIFAVFVDRKRIISRIYQKVIPDIKPIVEIIDDEKITHKLWKLDSPDLLEKIQLTMQDEDIFIADGHHRYEVSCTYRDLMKQKLGKITGEESFNYALAYFTNTEPRGLTILAIHRLLRLGAAGEKKGWELALKDYFEVKEIKDKTRFFFLMEKGGQLEHVIGMYKDKRYWLLRLKNIKILDKEISDKPAEYRSLDVAILNYLIFKKIMGINIDDKENLVFNSNTEELIEKVKSDDSYAAFFLNPVKIHKIISLAKAAEKMPPKTTYFYPKVASGLVINKHEED